MQTLKNIQKYLLCAVQSTMQYDPERNVYIDMENGAIIPASEEDVMLGISSSMPYVGVDNIGIEMTSTCEQDDMRYALALQQEEEQLHMSSRQTYNNQINGPKSKPEAKGARTTSSSITKQFMKMSRKPDAQKRLERATAISGENLEEETTEGTSDWGLARALQLQEFEIEQEMYAAEGGDFQHKEAKSSRCLRQLKTVSCAICLLQIAVLIFMIEDDGYADSSENPMMGPPATTLVRWGAKSSAHMVFKNEWWRLFSPIMLHAGIMHLVSNVFIQLRVGGYLNLVFGTKRWLTIYILSGVYGNMCSCCFLTDSIGVGSSGALLGILTAWIVYIVFRWRKVPENVRMTRNCQLLVVLFAVGFTLSMSFTNLVDWAAHFGGAIQGLLWGIILLSRELDDKNTRLYLRVAASITTVASFGYTIYYLIYIMKPDDSIFDLTNANDDWNKYPHNGE